MLVGEVLKAGSFSMREIAESAGLSYDAVRSWAANRRTPNPDNLHRLAAALRQRAASLSELAGQLEQAADEPPAA